MASIFIAIHAQVAGMALGRRVHGRSLWVFHFLCQEIWLTRAARPWRRQAKSASIGAEYHQTPDEIKATSAILMARPSAATGRLSFASPITINARGINLVTSNSRARPSAAAPTGRLLKADMAFVDDFAAPVADESSTWPHIAIITSTSGLGIGHAHREQNNWRR